MEETRMDESSADSTAFAEGHESQAGETGAGGAVRTIMREELGTALAENARTIVDETRAAVREEIPLAMKGDMRTIVYEEVRQAVADELRTAGISAGDIAIGARWEGGEVVLKPGREGVQEKTIPIETFFHKVVMARERLRVLEQRINNHPKLTDADRLELQDYITRIYGSFTTFNVLFADRADWFVGSGKG